MIKNTLGVGLLLVAGFVGYSMYNWNSGSGDQKVSSATVLTYSAKTSTTTSITGETSTVSDVVSSVNRISDTNNVVQLDAEVFGESVDLVISQLETLRHKGVKKAYLLITSPGGSVVAGAKLISYMDASSMEINTICEIMCASMAAHIHQAGKTRYMVDRSILMFHPASGGTQGTIEQMLSQLNMFKGFVDRLDANAARRSGTDYSKFKASVSQELWMDSQTAVEGKFTDGLAYVFWGKSKDDAFSAKKELKARNIVVPKYVTEEIPLSVRSAWANLVY